MKGMTPEADRNFLSAFCRIGDKIKDMDQIEEVRRKTDIVQLISEAVALKKAGRNFKGLCPFHEEKTPSFMVSLERQIFKCFGCFPAGQLIKTKAGLKRVEDIRKRESVFTHKARWRKVTRLLERDYRGDLIAIKTRKLKEEVRLTGDHKVYAIKTKHCKYQGRETRLCQSRCDRFCPEKYFKNYKVEKLAARSLSKEDYLLYPLEKTEKDLGEIDLKRYITKKLPPHGTKPMLANIFVNLCGQGAENKHIPFEFERLPKTKLKILLEAIFRGDGHVQLKRYKKNRPGNRTITTISSRLAFQIKEILLRLEYEPSVYIREAHKGKDGVNHKKSYTVYWRRDLKASYTSFWTEKGASYWLLPISEIKKSKFKGKVYNFTVEDDHSYVANSFVVANCGEGGDVYSWLMKREGMEFGEALRFLAQKAGVELKDFRPSGDQKLKERLLEINHLASEFYHYLLTEHKLGKRGLEYLLKRGVTKDSIRLFKLGYSPNEWQGLTDYLTKKKGYKLNELEQTGLAIKGNGGRYYDRFRGRIMFPLFDHRGRVVGFSGRVLNPEEKEAKYINSPETVLYHKSLILYGLEITKEAIKKVNRAIVVEGELDAISSYQAGVKNVAAIKGSALTEGQIELLKRFCENVSLALDSDAAGDAASRRGIELAENSGLSVRVIRVKYGKDPDECSQKSARLWKDSVNEAVPVYDFYLESGLKRYGVKTIEGKRKLSEEMAAILAKVDNEVIKAHYIKKLAKVLEVEEEAVRMEVEKKEKVGEVEPAFAEATARQSQTRQERLEEYLLALILQADEEMKKFVSLAKPEEWGETVIKKILEQLQLWFEGGKKWEINKFVKSLAGELVAQVDAAYLLDLGRLTEDRDRLEREVEKTLTDIKRLNIKQKLEQISGEISQAEKEKDKVKLNKLQREFREMAKGLI